MVIDHTPTGTDADTILTILEESRKRLKCDDASGCYSTVFSVVDDLKGRFGGRFRMHRFTLQLGMDPMLDGRWYVCYTLFVGGVIMGPTSNMRMEDDVLSFDCGGVSYSMKVHRDAEEG